MGRARKFDSPDAPLWTERQEEVLDLIARGRTNPEIAAALGITLDGAKWHVREIITKLGVENREEAAKYWQAQHSLGKRLTRGRVWLWPLNWQLAALGGASAAVLAVVAGIAAFAGSARNDEETTPTPQPPRTPVVIAPPPTFTTPASFTFGRGDTIDSPDGIVFLDPTTGGGTFWQLPVGATGFVSPDSRWIAWTERTYAGNQPVPDAIQFTHLLDTTTGADRPTGNDEHDWRVIGFSPDGTQYAALERRGGEVVLFETVSGNQLRQLAPPGSDRVILRLSNISWSPDGKHIAFVRCGPGVPNGAALYIDGRTVAVQACFSPWVTWSHDGTRIAVTGGEANESEGQAIVEVATGSLLKIPIRGANLRWSSDDRYLGVSDHAYKGLLRVFDSRSGTEVLRVQGSEAQHCHGDYWLPGTPRIAIDESRSVEVPSGKIVSRNDSVHTGFDEGRYSADGRLQLKFDGAHVTMLDGTRSVAEVDIGLGGVQPNIWAASTGERFIPFLPDGRGAVSLAPVSPSSFCRNEPGEELPFGVAMGPF